MSLFEAIMQNMSYEAFFILIIVNLICFCFFFLKDKKNKSLKIKSSNLAEIFISYVAIHLVATFSTMFLIASFFYHNAMPIHAKSEGVTENSSYNFVKSESKTSLDLPYYLFKYTFNLQGESNAKENGCYLSGKVSFTQENNDLIKVTPESNDLSGFRLIREEMARDVLVTYKIPSTESNFCLKPFYVKRFKVLDISNLSESAWLRNEPYQPFNNDYHIIKQMASDFFNKMTEENEEKDRLEKLMPARKNLKININ